MRGLSVEHFPDLPAQKLWRKGLLQESHAGLEHALGQDSALGVAGHEQHLDSGE